jgi:hypothetical protein
MPSQTMYVIGEMVFGQQDELPPPPPLAPVDDDRRGRYSVSPSSMPLETARQLLPFPLLLPQWLPGDLSCEPEIGVMNVPPPAPVMRNPALAGLFRPLVQVVWRDPASTFLSLTVRLVPPPGVHEVRLLQRPIDALAEVRVAAQPAALIHRSAGPTPAWRAIFPRPMLTLLWRADGLQYELEAGTDDLSAAELIQIAESVPLRAGEEAKPLHDVG